MPSIDLHCQSLPTSYSFNTEEIKGADVEISRSSSRVTAGENVEETHTLYLKNGDKLMLMTIENDEADMGNNKYLYCLQVYSEGEVNNIDDPHIHLWISKEDSEILKRLCLY